MELLIDLWNIATDWRLIFLMLSLVAMIVLTLWVFGRTSKARMAAGKEGRITAADYAIVGRDEPEDLAAYTRLIVNLFELPVLFYVLVLSFAVLSIESWLTVALAWSFVVLRFFHARIVIDGNRVMKRRRMFIRGVKVFMLLLLVFCVSLVFFADL